MENRQTLVIGALGVLVGMAVGATSATQAQTVSFSGMNPNIQADGGAEGYINVRENLSGVRCNTRDGVTHCTENYFDDYLQLRSNAARRAEERTAVHAASPEYGNFTVNYEALDAQFEECMILRAESGRNHRYWLCIGREQQNRD